MKSENTKAKTGKIRSTGFYIAVGALIAVAVILVVVLSTFIYRATHIESAFAADFVQTPQDVSLAASETEEETTEAETPTPEVTPEPTLSPEELLAMQSNPNFLKKRVNILLLGLDRSTERANWGVYRTDTMILVSCNLDDKSVSMISIPRDSYVKIHNKRSPDKINSAFGVGGGEQKNGYEYAMKTVSILLGRIGIAYYVGFDMNVVKEVVDAMGGVDYDVDIAVKMNGRVLQPGKQHLDGQQVLDYCRVRKGSSDVARVERQQKMLLALFDQMKSTKQLIRIPAIYQAVAQNIDTNLQLDQISSLALFANEIGLSNIQTYVVPGDFLTMNGLSYWGIANNKLKAMVDEVFGVKFNPNPALNVYALKAQAATQQQEQAAQKAAEEAAKAEASEELPDDDIPVEDNEAEAATKDPSEAAETQPQEQGNDGLAPQTEETATQTAVQTAAPQEQNDTKTETSEENPAA